MVTGMLTEESQPIWVVWVRETWPEPAAPQRTVMELLVELPEIVPPADTAPCTPPASRSRHDR